MILFDFIHKPSNIHLAGDSAAARKHLDGVTIMESQLIPIIIQLISGAVGGNIAGAAKNLSLGTAGNTVAGGIGGILLSQLLPLLSNGSLDSALSGAVGHIAGGGIGGIVLTAIIGLIKNAVAKQA